MATQTQDSGIGMALLRLLDRGFKKTDQFLEGPVSDVGAKFYRPETVDMAGDLTSAAARQFGSVLPPTPYNAYGLLDNPPTMARPEAAQGPNPNGVMNELNRQLPMEDFQMPKGDASFGENLPAVQQMPVQTPATQPETNPQPNQNDPLMAAILSIIGQKAESTPAQDPVNPDQVLEEYYARNPDSRPVEAPTSTGGKIWRWIQTVNGYAPNQRPRNPEEMMKLQADLGVSTEGRVGEQGLNRGMRATEHGARVGGQPTPKDVLGILAGKSQIEQSGNVQSRLQTEQAAHTKDINKANVGNQKEIIGATSAAQTSPGAIKSELAIRNPEGMTQQAFEEATGMKLTPEQWTTIVNSNNKAASPIEQIMAVLIAQQLGQRSGVGRGQQQQQVNLNALKQ